MGKVLAWLLLFAMTAALITSLIVQQRDDTEEIRRIAAQPLPEMIRLQQASAGSNAD